jgi:uncharacterized membrane protein required for colicin V production
MSPTSLTVILALAVLIFVVNGFYQGLVHMLGSMLGLAVGITIASRLDAVWGAWLAAATGWNAGVCTIIAFVAALIVFTRIFGFALHLFEKAFRVLRIPLIGLANRLAGGALGFFEGVLVTGATLLVIHTLPFPEAKRAIDATDLAGSLAAAAIIILPLLPKSVRAIYESI